LAIDSLQKKRLFTHEAFFAPGNESDFVIYKDRRDTFKAKLRNLYIQAELDSKGDMRISVNYIDYSKKELLPLIRAKQGRYSNFPLEECLPFTIDNMMTP
jgi:hypothetical protein